MAKSYLDYDGLLYFWGKLKDSFALISHTHTKSQITDFPSSMTPSSHTHGNIQNGGTLQTSDVAIASGDKLVITDSSNSNQVARSSLSFDGSTTSQALTKKGTFESFPAVAFKNIEIVNSLGNVTATIVADGAADTFQLVSGDNVGITGDPNNDKITINANTSQPYFKINDNVNHRIDGIFTPSGEQYITLTVDDTAHELEIGCSIPTGTAAQLSSGTDTTNRLWTPKIIADYVSGAIASAITGAAKFRGTVSASFAPSTYSAGDYWVVSAAGTYAGVTCESGDMIFCVSDRGSSFSNSDFDVVQTNLEGAITNAQINTIIAS